MQVIIIPGIMVSLVTCSSMVQGNMNMALWTVVASYHPHMHYNYELLYNTHWYTAMYGIYVEV